jgi:hypothetical protein
MTDKPLDSAGLWRVERLHCHRALSAIEDSLCGMLTSETSCLDDPTARVQLQTSKRAIDALIAHLNGCYDFSDFLDGAGRGSAELKENVCLD